MAKSADRLLFGLPSCSFQGVMLSGKSSIEAFGVGFIAKK